jgi:hypothetical protein
MDSTGSSQDAAATLRSAAKVDHRLIPQHERLRSSCFARPLRVEFTNSHATHAARVKTLQMRPLVSGRLAQRVF